MMCESAELVKKAEPESSSKERGDLLSAEKRKSNAQAPLRYSKIYDNANARETIEDERYEYTPYVRRG